MNHLFRKKSVPVRKASQYKEDIGKTVLDKEIKYEGQSVIKYEGQSVLISKTGLTPRDTLPL